MFILATCYVMERGELIESGVCICPFVFYFYPCITDNTWFCKTLKNDNQWQKYSKRKLKLNPSLVPFLSNSLNNNWIFWHPIFILCSLYIVHINNFVMYFELDNEGMESSKCRPILTSLIYTCIVRVIILLLLLYLSGKTCIVIGRSSVLYRKVWTTWLPGLLSTSIQFPRDMCNKHLTNLVFLVHTLSSAPSFFPLQFMARMWTEVEKMWSITYSMELEVGL